MDIYEEKLGIKHFDLAIDFDICTYLQNYCYSFVFIKDMLGNMGLGINDYAHNKVTPDTSSSKIISLYESYEVYSTEN